MRRRTYDGRELVVRVVGAGDLAGTMRVASQRAFFDTVALSDCRAILWPTWEISALAAKNAGFARDLVDQGLTVP